MSEMRIWSNNIDPRYRVLWVRWDREKHIQFIEWCLHNRIVLRQHPMTNLFGASCLVDGTCEDEEQVIDYERAIQHVESKYASRHFMAMWYLVEDEDDLIALIKLRWS